MRKKAVLFACLAAMFVSGTAFAENLIVKMKAPKVVPGTVSAAGAESVRTMAATMTAAGAGGMVLKVYENLVLDGEVLALMRPVGDAKAFAEALAKDANVGGVAFDRPIYGTGAEIAAKGVNNFNTEMIDAPLADVDVSGQVVYVLDTGIDSQGPLGHLIDYSLSRAYLDEPGDAGMPEWQDYNGHGTFVSSVTVADGKLDVTGVAPGARVAAMKVMGVNKKGSTNFIVDALNDIAGHQFEGVRAINMSLGYFFPHTPEEIAAGQIAGGGYDPVYFALEAMDKQDRFVFVTSAGNENLPVGKPVERGGDGWDAGEYVYPGSYIGLKGLVTVGSINKDGSASDFSNYSGEFVHFQAPGKGIVGYGSGTARGGFDEPVLFGKGTSMSSPHIAGMVAALSAKDPGLGAAAIIEKMARSTKAAPAMKSNGEPLSKYGTPSLAKAAGIDPAGPGTPGTPDVPRPPVDPNPSHGFFEIDFDLNPDPGRFLGQPVDLGWKQAKKWRVAIGNPVTSGDKENAQTGFIVKVYGVLNPMDRRLSKLEVETAAWGKAPKTRIEVKNDVGEWVSDDNLVFRHVNAALPYEYRVVLENGTIEGGFYDEIKKTWDNPDYKANISLAVIKSMTWSREGDATRTRVKFPKGGHKVVEMEGAPDYPEHQNELVKGSGCDAGFGSVGLIAAAALIVLKKKK